LKAWLLEHEGIPAGTDLAWRGEYLDDNSALLSTFNFGTIPGARCGGDVCVVGTARGDTSLPRMHVVCSVCEHG
jgi:hypothetical protein